MNNSLWRNGLGAVLSLALCLGIWQFAAQHAISLGFITFQYVPTPRAVLAAAVHFFSSSLPFQHVGNSLARVLSGYALAVILGVSIGVLIGRLRWAKAGLLPPLELLRPIPAVAWIPLAILMFTSSEASMIFITFTGAFFPILLSTLHGVESVDPRLIASVRSLGAKPWSVLFEVILPGALPSIFTGLAIGMGTSWFCLITAEMISGQFGIGYYTWESYTLQNYPDIIVGMLLIGLLGLASSALVRALGHALTPWQSKEA